MTQPTMQDVAHVAGVSRALVSLVMREAPNVSIERRNAVLEAAATLGYRPNVLARNLASRRTKTLGVMINDLHNSFFAEAVDGMQERADRAGYQLLLATGRTTRSGESGAIETFLRFRVDGLVLAGPELPASDIDDAAEACPTVLLSRTVRSKLVDTVNGDERVGAHLAVQHLVGLGHTRIAHIDGGNGAGGRQRRAGYERAMREFGLERAIRVIGGHFSERSGGAGAHLLLADAQRPTAIFAANDLIAVGVLDHAGQIGLRVPDDLSIVGYDGTTIASMHCMSLTTINQPRQQMGGIAIDLLLERLNEDRTTAVHHIVTPTLVDRSSTGPLTKPEEHNT